MLALATDLGLRVVAEGVETEDQARALLEHGCELAQGLLYGGAALIDELAPATPDTPVTCDDTQGAARAAIDPEQV